MAQLGDLIVSGKSRFLNTINTSEIDLTTDSTHYGSITPTKIKYQDGTYNQTELTGNKLEVKTNQNSTSVTPSTLEISSSTKKLTMVANDITKTNDTWDGTNASLTTAVTNAKGTVKQNVLSTPSTNSYKLLLSGSADTSAHTEGVYKYSTLEFTPDNNESVLDGNTLSMYNNSWETVIRLSCGTSPYVYVKDSSTTCLKAYNSNMIIGNNISNPTKYVQSGLDSTDSTPFVELRDITSDSIYSWSRIKPEEIKVAKSQVGSMSIQPSDIVNGGTWDSTNTSLKTALANKISKETNTSVSWTSSATGRAVTCMLAKIGTIVICTITGSTDANHSITAWTATQLGAGQIPAGYRPSSATEGRIPTQTGGAVITVNTVGTVAITTWNNLGGQMAFGGTFWWKTS